MVRRGDSGIGCSPIFAGAVFVVLTLFIAVAVFAALRVSAAPTGSTTDTIAVQSEPGWAWDCIECNEVTYLNPQRALAVDKNGKVHAVFGGEKVIYTHEAGGTWRRDVIDELGSFYNVTLVLDSQGRPNIAYYESTRNDIRFARWTGSRWERELVYDDLVDSDGNLDLDLDSQDRPHVVFPDPALRYAVRIGARWEVSQIQKGWYDNVDLVLDAADQPHIVYLDHGGYPAEAAIEYLTRQGAEWRKSRLAVAEILGAPVLRFASNTGLHLLYRASVPEGNGDLEYGRLTQQGWVTETVATGVIGDYDLALDREGRPYAAYNLETAGTLTLFLAHRAAVSWETEAHRAVMYELSLALDGETPVEFVYYDYEADAVAFARYSRSAPAGWQAPVTLGGGTRLWLDRAPSLAVDQAGNMYASFTTWAGRKMTLARMTQGVPGWTSERSLEGVATAELTTDEQKRPILCYGALAIACVRIDGSTWVTITTPLEAAVLEAATTDAQGRPHVLVTGADSALRYARWLGDRWDSQTIDPKGIYETAHLALDNAGLPHVLYSRDLGDCYRGVPCYELVYVQWDGAQWRDATPTEAGQTRALGLAVDSGGRSHVVYADDTAVYYAVRTGDRWTATAMNLPGAVRYFAFILSPTGQMHASYCETNYYKKNDLIYVQGGETAWTATKLEGDARSCRYPAIVLDARGVPHIASYDAEGDDVLHVTQVENLLPTPTPTPSLPWANWANPELPLFVTRDGTDVAVVFGNLPPTTPLSARISGPASFAGGNQSLVTALTENGMSTLHILPEDDSPVGSPVVLTVDVYDAHLVKNGSLALQIHLPVVGK